MLGISRFLRATIVLKWNNEEVREMSKDGLFSSLIFGAESLRSFFEQITQSNQFNNLDIYQEKNTSVSLHNNILHQFTVYVIIHHKPFALKKRSFYQQNQINLVKSLFEMAEWNFDICDALFVMEHIEKQIMK